MTPDIESCARVDRAVEVFGIEGLAGLKSCIQWAWAWAMGLALDSGCVQVDMLT